MNKPGIVIWRIPLQFSGEELDACRDLLSEEERERAEKFRFDWLKRRYIVAHGHMRAILASYTGIPARELQFQITAFGKPFLDATFGVHFNLSHSGELAILAVGTNEMGADVEFIRSLYDFESIASGFFSAREISELQQYAAPERIRAFYRCWTRKEAFIKAIGKGLSIPLSSFAMSLEEDRGELLEITPPEQVTDWTITALDLGPDYVGAVAMRGEPRTVAIRDWGKVRGPAQMRFEPGFTSGRA